MHKTSAWPLALVYAALIVYASLYPFAEWRDQGIWPWAFLVAPLPRYWTWFDVVANVMGYVPLGFLLALAFMRSGRGRRAVLRLGRTVAKETGQPFKPAANGEYVAGTYRQRLTLASGRFAMIDDGLGFQLVPWSPSLESQRGKHVSGVARDDGGIDWSFGRNRGLGM
mgnify:CR=1 FL=1